MFHTAFALLALATSFAGPTPLPRAPAAAKQAAQPPLSYEANDLYSIRARRRMAHYLRLRLMELHAARFERIEKVIRGELSVDDLFRDP